MKRLARYLFLLAFVVQLSGCMSSEQKALQSTVEFLDEDCPQPLGTFAYIDSICYDSKDNLVKIGVILDEDVISLITMWLHYDELIVPTIISYFSDYEPNLFSLMADADAQLKVYFNQQSTGECTIVPVTPENVKEYYDKTLSKKELANVNFENLLISEQSRIGEISKGITQERVASDDVSLIYELKFDVAEHSYGDYLVKKRQIHDDYMKIYSDPAMRDFLQIIKDTNRYIVIRHKFDTERKQFNIVITTYDIDTILNGQ